MRALAGLAVVVALFGGACATKTKTTTTGPQTYTVQIDGKTAAFNGVFTRFFPNALSAHPGDSVKFKLTHFNGDPHTVTFGTLVDAASKKVDALGANATLDSLFGLDDTAEFNKVPDVFF